MKTMETPTSTTLPPEFYPTKYWHQLSDGRVQCDICPRQCKLNEGQQGFCFVRARKNNQIVLTTFGRSSGFCIDPIEKKPLFHFLPGSSALSFGTVGCNLMCQFCQNWDISKSKEMNRLASIAMPEAIARAAKYYNCSSVAYTYNDPVTFLEYVIETAKACHKENIKSVAITAGYINPEPLKELATHMDVIKVDLKAFTESFYDRISGGHLQPVLNTISYIKQKTPVWLELVTLLIPGENDSDNELDLMTQWIVNNVGPDVPLHFSAFFPEWKMLDKEPTPLETLIRARTIAMKNGLKYVYTGNLNYDEGSNTYCPQCHRCIIKRILYVIDDYRITPEGNCQFCGAHCPGIFNRKQATWNGESVPISMEMFA